MSFLVQNWKKASLLCLLITRLLNVVSQLVTLPRVMRDILGYHLGGHGCAEAVFYDSSYEHKPRDNKKTAYKQRGDCA